MDCAGGSSALNVRPSLSLLSPPNVKPLQFAWLFAITLSQRSTLIRIFQALQSFVQGYEWVFELLFPQLGSCLFLSQKWYLCELHHGIHPSYPWLLSWPKGFCFLTLTQLFGSCCFDHLAAVEVQLFPHTPFNSFENCLAEGMPARINQRKSHLFSSMWSTLVHAFSVFTSSGYAPPQVTYIHCTAVVYFDEAS